MKEIFDMLLESLKGIIVLWSGSIATIPNGWQLCDGTNGTPDLKSKFILGAGAGVAPGLTGGLSTHSHTGDTSFDTDVLDSGDKIGIGGAYDNYTTGHQHNLSISAASNMPPFYALCYIQKI